MASDSKTTTAKPEARIFLSLQPEANNRWFIKITMRNMKQEHGTDFEASIYIKYRAPLYFPSLSLQCRVVELYLPPQ